MYRDGTIRKYLDDAAAGIPAPGGGSVSAFAASLATTMGSMAGNFTVGKKKYREVEQTVKGILERLAALRERLLELADEDVEAYGVVSGAYAMPKETDDQKTARTARIQEALKVAMDVPLRTVRTCTDVLDELGVLVDVANPNLITDVGVSAILAEAALRGAKLNVEINLAFLKDEELVSKTAREVKRDSEKAAARLCEVMGKVDAKIKS